MRLRVQAHLRAEEKAATSIEEEVEQLNDGAPDQDKDSLVSGYSGSLPDGESYSCHNSGEVLMNPSDQDDYKDPWMRNPQVLECMSPELKAHCLEVTRTGKSFFEL